MGGELQWCREGGAGVNGVNPEKKAEVAELNKLACRRRAKLISQRSLHNAPIFRLLLKVAVNGTHQCDFPNFCGQQCPTRSSPCPMWTRSLHSPELVDSVTTARHEVQSKGSG